MGRTSVAILIGGMLAASALAQEFPRPTRDGQRAADGLLRRCLERGAIEVVKNDKNGSSYRRVVDRGKLVAVLRAERGRLTPEAGDALVALWLQVKRAEEPFVIDLLRAAGEAVPDRRLCAFADAFQAMLHFRGENLAPALRSMEKAAEEFAAVKGYESWQAECLNQVGRIAWLQKRYDRAASAFAKALPLFESNLGKSHRMVAAAASNLGNALYHQGRRDEALKALARAAAILKGLKDDPHAGLSHIYTTMANIYQTQGEMQRAEEHLHEALAIRKRVLGSFDPETAKAYDNLGDLLRERGDYGGALAAYTAAREVFAKRPNSLDAAINLSCFAQLYEALGEYHKMVEVEQQALDVYRAVYGDIHMSVAASLTRLGTAYARSGEAGMALKMAERSLAVRRRINGDRHISVVVGLSHVGFAHSRLQEYKTAAKHYRAALKLVQEIPDCPPYEIGTQFNNLGFVYSQKGEHEQAVQHFRRARDYFVKTAASGLALLTVDGNIAMELHAAGRHKEAIELQKQVAATTERQFGRQHPEIARAFYNLAGMHHSAGDNNEAMRALDRAVEALLLDPKAAGRAGGVLRPADLHAGAITVAVLSLRARLQELGLATDSSPAELRSCLEGYRAAGAVGERYRTQALQTGAAKLVLGETVAEITPRLVGLCARLQRREDAADAAETAFEAVEQARARVFLEDFARSRAHHLGGVSEELRRQEVFLNANRRRLDERISQEQLKPAEQRDADRVRKLQEELRAVEKRWQEVVGRMERQYPAYARFRYPKPCTISEARDCLREGEVALLFSLGKKDSYVVVIDSQAEKDDKTDGLTIVALPAAQKIQDIVATLTDPDNLALPTRARALGEEAYELILKPLAGRISGKDLLIVPDGSLAHLPFELLVEPSGAGGKLRYLIERRRVRYAPSLTALHVMRLAQAKRERQPDLPLFAVGDPIYDLRDKRLSGTSTAAKAEQDFGSGESGRKPSDEILPRLLNATVEVETVAKILGAKREHVLLGRDATEARVKAASVSGPLGRARLVHFATHGILAFGDGRQPALVLSRVGASGKTSADGTDDGVLTLAEVTFLKLNADLVVLSACRTGQGQLYGGEGVMGLARAFLHAGSGGVVCSLWSVDDRATAALMADFYRHMQAGRSASEALRQARLRMIREGRAPFFWAPFILIGE